MYNFKIFLGSIVQECRNFNIKTMFDFRITNYNLRGKYLDLFSELRMT